MSAQLDGAVVAALSTVAILAAAGLVSRIVSRSTGWAPAGPIALIAAAPLIPRLPLMLGLSADDLLPVLGVALLVWRRPVPGLTSDRLLRWILLGVAVATVARTGSALVNGDGLQGTAKMLAQAIGRPVVLVAIAAYGSVAAPERLRHRFIGVPVAAVATFEALFGVLGFVFRLPGGAGIEAARQLTSLYGVCPGRITGTMGLSANHIGAMFVLSIPITLAVAITSAGWRRWAWGAAAALQCAALVLTFTRSSIALGLVLAFGFLIYQRKAVMLAFVTAIATLIVVAAFTVSCTAAAPLIGRFSDGNDRLALWYAAGAIVIDHPLVGVGLDRMGDVVKANPERYRNTPFGPGTSTAHNTILLAAAETGVAGGLGILAVNIGLAGLALRGAWRGRRPERAFLLAAALALGAYLVQGMFNNLFSVPATSVVMALVVAAIACSGSGVADPDTEPSPGSPRPTGPYTSPSLDPRPSPDGEH